MSTDYLDLTIYLVTTVDDQALFEASGDGLGMTMGRGKKKRLHLRCMHLHDVKLQSPKKKRTIKEKNCILIRANSTCYLAVWSCLDC